MKLKEIRDDYYLFTGKTSDITRSLNFAGIAVVWFFHANDTSAGAIKAIPQVLLWPLWFFVLSLGLDLFQYLYSTIVWGIYNWAKHKKNVGLDDEVNPPAWINRFSLTCFGLKIVSCMAGYYLVLRFIVCSLQ